MLVEQQARFGVGRRSLASAAISPGLKFTRGKRTWNYDVPVACATKWSGSVSQLSFRIFLPRGFYLERDGGARVPIVDPRRKTFNQGSALNHSRRQLLAKRCHRASILTCKERDDCSHNDPYSGEPCSCLCPPRRILLQFFGAVPGRLVLFPEPTLYVAAQHFAIAKSRHNRTSTGTGIA
jgi:hypothetical protein